MYIKDPRLARTWGGTGPLPKALRAYRRAHAADPRVGPYRRHTWLPLGLSLAPAFASALSGKMVQFLTSLGIKSTMYVENLLICADDACF